MDETKKALLTIDIDVASLNQNTANAKKQVADLTAQLKALKGTTHENSAEAVQLAAQLKNSQAEVRNGVTVAAQYDKALQSNTGYLDGLKIELSLLQKQWGNLTKEQLANVEVGGKIEERSKALAAEIQKLDQKVGNNKTTIGDYENSIVSALGKTGLFGDVFSKATDVANAFGSGISALKDTLGSVGKTVDDLVKSTGIFTNTSTVASASLSKVATDGEKASEELVKVEKGAEESGTALKLMGTNGGIAAKGIDAMGTSTETTTGIMKLLKIALIETGIGAFIVAIGTLIAYFTQTNEGAKKFQVITNAIGAVLGAVMKIIAPIGKAIYDVFTEPQGAVKLMTSLFSLSILPIKTLATVLWDLLHGNFKKAFTDIGDGMTDFAKKTLEAKDAAVHMFNDTKKAAGAAADEIKKVDFGKTIKDSMDATKARQALTKEERLWSEEKLKQQGEVELLTKKLRDQGISEKERMKLAEEAKSIREKIFQGDIDLAKKNEVLVEKEQSLNSKKDFQAITDAKNRVQEIINAKDSEVQGIQNRESRLQKSTMTAQQVADKLMKEAESERLSSIARTSQALYDSFADELSKTEDKYRKLIEKYSDYKGKDLKVKAEYADTVKQLEVERQAELKKVADKFNKEATDNLNALNKELADIRSKASTDETQKQIDALNQQTKDKLDKLDSETEAIGLKIAEQIQSANDLRAKGNQKEAADIDKNIATEVKSLESAGQIREALLKQQIEDEARIRKEAANKKANEHLEGDIIGDQVANNSLKEFADRQKLLDQEHKQAIAAAKLKGEDTYKIDHEYKQKTEALSKDKLKFEVDTAKGIISMLGKNTEAYKVAFKAYQAYQAANVVVDTSKTIMGIWSANAEIPFVGVPTAIAETAIAAAVGAKSLADIWSAKGFATGGVYRSDGYGGKLSGPGTGTSDSINARLSHGESIINARSTALFAPILSALNVAGGGRAFDMPNLSNHFANGGIFNNMIADNSGIQSQIINNLNQAINGLPERIGAHIAASTPKQVLVIEDVQAGLQNKTMLHNMSNF